MGFTTIIVSCDLSARSDQARERAIGIALVHRAKLVLVHGQAGETPSAEVDSAVLAQRQGACA